VFLFPGLVLLIGLIYLRPQEFLPTLAELPLLHLLVALALFGLVLGLRRRRTGAFAAPQLAWVALFTAWCLVTAGHGELGNTFVVVGTPVLLFALIAQGIRTFRAFQGLAVVLLAIVLVLSAVGVHQGLAPLGCLAVDEASQDGTGVFDGRACITRRDCEGEGAEPNADYLCERIGIFGTSTIGGGRVRYRGHLNDPNELALVIGIGVPFAFALFERRRSLARLVLLGATLALVGTCTVMTQSRGGQMVFLVVLGAYLLRRFGALGLLLGAAVALPITLFGGRSGVEADSSSFERIDAWYTGISLFLAHPLFGVGQGQFVEHHTQTAHNSFLLAAAELGLPGMICWSVIVYLSTKIPLRALATLPAERAAERTWAMALLASLLGLWVGSFFLSFCYHPVLWIYVGLAGAYAAAMRTHDPDWRVDLGWRDLGIIVGIDLGLLFALFVYTRLKA
jgi:O-antigen ligase